MDQLKPARSLFETFLRAVADHYTRDNPNREEAYLSMVSTLYALAAAQCGGEWVYVPRTNAVEWQQTHQRIVKALQSGDTPTQIAAREGVSRELAAKVRRRLRGTIGP